MITTTNLNELFQIVNVEHGEPHHVLGMHEVEHEGEKFVALGRGNPPCLKKKLFTQMACFMV